MSRARRPQGETRGCPRRSAIGEQRFLYAGAAKTVCSCFHQNNARGQRRQIAGKSGDPFEIEPAPRSLAWLPLQSTTGASPTHRQQTGHQCLRFSLMRSLIRRPPSVILCVISRYRLRLRRGVIVRVGTVVVPSRPASCPFRNVNRCYPTMAPLSSTFSGGSGRQRGASIMPRPPAGSRRCGCVRACRNWPGPARRLWNDALNCQRNGVGNWRTPGPRRDEPRSPEGVLDRNFEIFLGLRSDPPTRSPTIRLRLRRLPQSMPRHLDVPTPYLARNIHAPPTMSRRGQPRPIRTSAFSTAATSSDARPVPSVQQGGRELRQHLCRHQDIPASAL